MLCENTFAFLSEYTFRISFTYLQVKHITLRLMIQFSITIRQRVCRTSQADPIEFESAVETIEVNANVVIHTRVA